MKEGLLDGKRVEQWHAFGKARCARGTIKAYVDHVSTQHMTIMKIIRAIQSCRHRAARKFYISPNLYYVHTPIQSYP